MEVGVRLEVFVGGRMLVLVLETEVCGWMRILMRVNLWNLYNMNW